MANISGLMTMTEDEFVRLKKYLQSPGGELLVDVLRRNVRIEDPPRTAGVLDAGLLGSLYGTALGFQKCVDMIEGVRDRNPEEPKPDIEADYNKDN